MPVSPDVRCLWPDPCGNGPSCDGCARMEELVQERAAGFQEALDAVVALLEAAPAAALFARSGADAPAGEFLERRAATRLVRERAGLLIVDLHRDAGQPA